MMREQGWASVHETSLSMNNITCIKLIMQNTAHVSNICRGCSAKCLRYTSRSLDGWISYFTLLADVYKLPQ